MSDSGARAAISWSGGKDSCLALLRAAEDGLPADTLVTMMDPGGPSKSHALPAALFLAQAEAMSRRWLPVEAGLAQYAGVFDAALHELRDTGHTHMIFGDIDLQAHRDWLEPACRKAGLEAVFPLWRLPRESVAQEVIARGILARVVCVDSGLLDAGFCGAEYDDAFLARLPAGVCPCGENGEFHTFVWDSPSFDRPLRLTAGEQRRVASMPPLRPTELVFEEPVLHEAKQ